MHVPFPYGMIHAHFGAPDAAGRGIHAIAFIRRTPIQNVRVPTRFKTRNRTAVGLKMPTSAVRAAQVGAALIV